MKRTGGLAAVWAAAAMVLAVSPPALADGDCKIWYDSSGNEHKDCAPLPAKGGDGTDKKPDGSVGPTTKGAEGGGGDLQTGQGSGDTVGGGGFSPPPPGEVYESGDDTLFGDGSPTGVTSSALESMLRGGQADKVEDLMDRVLQYNPQQPKALAMRSVARLNQDKNDGALKDAQAALKLEPQNKLARQVSDFITLSGQAKDTGVKLRKPDFGGKKDLASAFDGGAGRAGRTGMLGGQPSRSGAQAPGGASDGVSASGGWVSSGRGPGAGAYAPAAQMTLPMSQGLTPSQMSVREASKKLRLGDASGALLDATRAIQEDGANTHAWGLRSSVQNKLRNYDAAISDATEALKIDAKNVPALLERGFAQYNLSNYSAALADIGEALALEPMNALAYLYRGMIFEKMSRYTEALSDYEMAARLDPSLRHFWEEAKKRLLGGKKAQGQAGSLVGGRPVLWLAAGGAALFLVLFLLWRKRRRRAQAGLEAESPEEAGPPPEPEVPATVSQPPGPDRDAGQDSAQ